MANTVAAGLGVVILGAVVVILALFLFSAFLQLSYNGFVPNASSKAKPISYWNAMAFLFLIFFIAVVFFSTSAAGKWAWGVNSGTGSVGAFLLGLLVLLVFILVVSAFLQLSYNGSIVNMSNGAKKISYGNSIAFFFLILLLGGVFLSTTMASHWGLSSAPALSSVVITLLVLVAVIFFFSWLLQQSYNGSIVNMANGAKTITFWNGMALFFFALFVGAIFFSTTVASTIL